MDDETRMPLMPWPDGAPGWWGGSSAGAVLAPRTRMHLTCRAAPPAYGTQAYRCSRPDGHTGRHACYGSKYVLAVWS